MALMQTLSDNFNDNSINTAIWDADNATESGGQLSISLSTGQGTFNGLYSDSTYDLTASYAHVQLVSAGSLAVNTAELYPVELYDATQSDYLYWALEYASDELVAYKIDGSLSELYRVAYNSSTHAWLRIREASGTIYFDSSTDGLNWTNRASTTVGFAVTALHGAMDATNPSSGSTTAVFDNWNVTPSVANLRRYTLTTLGVG